MSKNLRAISTAATLFSAVLSFGTSASAAQDPCRSLSPGNAFLPPVANRELIGTWLEKTGPYTCAISLEKVKGKVFLTTRCDNVCDESQGQPVQQISSKKFKVADGGQGYYLVILPNGNVSVRDADGEIQLDPKHASLWPKGNKP